MRHRHGLRKLNRTTSHRLAMLRNMTNSLLTHEVIRTTLPKAKELRRVAERLINAAGADRVFRHISDAVERGGTLLYGGELVKPGPHLNGHFVLPTIITAADNTMLVLQEETFGPVAAIVPFTKVDEAIALANDSDYGLCAYVYCENARTLQRLTDELDAGMVVVNQATGSGVQAPQGGIKQSGYGLEGGREGLEEFTYQKYVSTAF